MTVRQLLEHLRAAGAVESFDAAKAVDPLAEIGLYLDTDLAEIGEIHDPASDLRRIVSASGAGIVTVLDELGADRLEALGIESQLDPEEARREARARLGEEAR